MITEMTTEQEALIPFYRQKWCDIAISTERINRETASAVIQRAYALIGKVEPRIIFCDSPHDYTLKVSEFLQTSEPPNLVSAMGELNEMLSGYLQEIGTQLKNVVEEELKSTVEQDETLSPALDNDTTEKFLKKFSELEDDELFDDETLEDDSESEQLLEQVKRKFPQFQPPSELGEELNIEIEYNNDLMSVLEKQVSRNLQKRISKLFEGLDDFYIDQTHKAVYEKIYALPNRDSLWTVIHNCIAPDSLAENYTWFDFYISVLGCKYHSEKWQVSLDLLQTCGYIYPFEHICFICDRPIKVALDNEDRLHAEGEPAIVFADGFSIYAYRGIPLSGKYVDIHPRHWESTWYLEESSSELKQALLEALPQEALQPQWLLQEYDTEIRQRLVQQIGFERICEELQVEEIDAWQESVLLKIETSRDQQASIDDSESDEEEPIILLKTTSQETGQIQVTCMESHITSVQEALDWLSYEEDSD